VEDWPSRSFVGGQLIAAAGALSSGTSWRARPRGIPSGTVREAERVFRKTDPNFEFPHLPVEIRVGDEAHIMFHGRPRIQSYNVWVEHGFYRGHRVSTNVSRFHSPAVVLIPPRSPRRSSWTQMRLRFASGTGRVDVPMRDAVCNRRVTEQERTLDAETVRGASDARLGVGRIATDGRTAGMAGSRSVHGCARWTTGSSFSEVLSMEHADALLVIQAEDPSEIMQRLAADPWALNDVLVAKDCWPWRIRLGSLDQGGARCEGA